MDNFLKQYLITALWSSSDQDGEHFDKNYDIEDISEESISEAQKDCESFQEKAGEILDNYEDSKCGHDFWLTRNGHGSGFWDKDFYSEKDKESLTKISKEFSQVDMYLGDDGKIYIH
jgi:hypothetical protein